MNKTTWAPCWGDALVLTPDQFEIVLTEYGRIHNTDPDVINRMIDDPNDTTFLIKSDQVGAINFSHEMMYDQLVRDIYDEDDPVVQQNQVFSIDRINIQQNDGITFIPNFRHDGTANIRIKRGNGEPTIWPETQDYYDDVYVIWSEHDRTSIENLMTPVYEKLADSLSEYESKIGLYTGGKFDIKDCVGFIAYATYTG